MKVALSHPLAAGERRARFCIFAKENKAEKIKTTICDFLFMIHPW
ncbi:MAG: hypothetical protein PVI11_04450 [Candidatus Aminicenantes bacterium]